MENPAKAIEMYQRAERLSPLDPRGWLIATGLGMAFFHQERFDEAASLAEKALVDNLRCTIALRTLAGSLAKVRRREEAAVVVQKLLKIEPQLTLSAWRARLRWLDNVSGLPGWISDTLCRLATGGGFAVRQSG